MSDTAPITILQQQYQMHYVNGVWHGGTIAECKYCVCKCEETCPKCGKRKA